MTDEEKKAYWATQIEWAVKTVGVSGLVLGAMLYGLYQIAMHTIDTMKPYADKVVTAHVDYLHKQGQISEKNQDTLEQLVELNQLTAQLVREVHQTVRQSQLPASPEPKP